MSRLPEQTASHRHQGGFTLLEVLVALAILAIALASLVKVASNHTLNTEHLRNKTLAHWVALNQITQLQVRNEWPPTGKKSGTETMGLHEWHWRREIKTTPDDRVRQLEISVYKSRGDSNPVTRLTSFLSKPK